MSDEDTDVDPCFPGSAGESDFSGASLLYRKLQFLLQETSLREIKHLRQDHVITIQLGGSVVSAEKCSRFHKSVRMGTRKLQKNVPDSVNQLDQE